jgi:hypothetical protein
MNEMAKTESVGVGRGLKEVESFNEHFKARIKMF